MFGCNCCRCTKYSRPIKVRGASTVDVIPLIGTTRRTDNVSIRIASRLKIWTLPSYLAQPRQLSLCTFPATLRTAVAPLFPRVLKALEPHSAGKGTTRTRTIFVATKHSSSCSSPSYTQCWDSSTSAPNCSLHSSSIAMFER